MDKLPTVDVRGALALAGMAFLAGACDFAEAPDPRILARENPPPVITQFEAAIAPATGSLVGMHRPMAAPMAETAAVARTQLSKPETLLVVVGHNAQPSFDTKLQAAYQGSLTGQLCQNVVCTDREAIELLMIGRADFGLIGGSLSQREIHAGLRQTMVGVELFALSVSPLSSVRSLSRTQVRQIFTGQVTDWQQLGFDAGAIVPIVPSDSKLAERAQRILIPGDSFASTCVAVRSEQHVADQVLQHRGAIGIVRVTAQPRAAGQKLIQIDWTPPTASAFGYGTYTFGIPLQLVTSGRPNEDALDFLSFARSERGQSLLARTLTFVR